MSRVFLAGAFVSFFVLSALVPVSRGLPAAAHAAQAILSAQNSGKCLTVHPADHRNGAAVYQWTCGTSKNVEIVDSGDGWHYVKFVHSGKCLTVSGFASWDGATLDQWDCLGGANQKWSGTFVEATGFFEIHGSQAYPNKCLTVDGESTQDGALINQWECSNQPNQMWTIGQPRLAACSNYSVSATVSDANPPVESTVVVRGTITCGGQGVLGAAMRVTWNFSKGTFNCIGVSGSAGTSLCALPISKLAVAGEFVRLDVCFSSAEFITCFETGFTPR